MRTEPGAIDWSGLLAPSSAPAWFVLASFRLVCLLTIADLVELRHALWLWFLLVFSFGLHIVFVAAAVAYLVALVGMEAG